MTNQEPIITDKKRLIENMNNLKNLTDELLISCCSHEIVSHHEDNKTYYSCYKCGWKRVINFSSK